MKAKIKYIILALVLSITLFSMKEGYACSVNKLTANDVGTQEQTEQLECLLEEQFIFDNFTYWYSVNPGATINNSSVLYICIFENNVDYRISVSTQTNYNTYTFQYKKADNTWNGYKCIRTSLGNLNGANGEMGLNKWGQISQPSNMARSNMTFYSSIDLYDTNNTIQIQKTFTYTKPTCESGGGGPVSINNWPITKEEFYVLIIALCVLIFMLFFKWCFPNTKGGNKK